MALASCLRLRDIVKSPSTARRTPTQRHLANRSLTSAPDGTIAHDNPYSRASKRERRCDVGLLSVARTSPSPESKKLIQKCRERRQSKARGSDKIVGNDFEPLEAGPEGASPKDRGESEPQCTNEYMRILSHRATPLRHPPQFLKQLLRSHAGEAITYTSAKGLDGLLFLWGGCYRHYRQGYCYLRNKASTIWFSRRS